MNVQQVLQLSFKGAHDILAQVIADLDAEALTKVPSGANIQSIQAILAHAVIAEDFIVNGMVARKAPVSTAAALEGTGVPPVQMPRLTPDWAANIKMDLPRFRGFAAKVFAATEETVAAMSDEALDAEIDGPIGKRPAAAYLTGFALYHTISHTGEIAALKGVHGLTGLPF